MGWIMLIVLLVFLIPIAMWDNSEKQKARELERTGQQDFIQRNNIDISAEYHYQNTLNNVSI